MLFLGASIASSVICHPLHVIMMRQQVGAMTSRYRITRLSVPLSVCDHMSLFLSVSQSICLPNCMAINPVIYLSIHLSNLSIYLPIYHNNDNDSTCNIPITSTFHLYLSLSFSLFLSLSLSSFLHLSISFKKIVFLFFSFSLSLSSFLLFHCRYLHIFFSMLLIFKWRHAWPLLLCTRGHWDIGSERFAIFLFWYCCCFCCDCFSFLSLL